MSIKQQSNAGVSIFMHTYTLAIQYQPSWKYY